jgi:hypothetical protein
MHSRKKSSKNWFNTNCVNAKNDFKRARYNFNRNKTNENRILSTRVRTKYMYDKVKEKAYNMYKIRQAKKVSNLAKYQPRQFWKKIENLKDAPLKADNLNFESLFNILKAYLARISRAVKMTTIFHRTTSPTLT